MLWGSLLKPDLPASSPVSTWWTKLSRKQIRDLQLLGTGWQVCAHWGKSHRCSAFQLVQTTAQPL